MSLSRDGWRRALARPPTVWAWHGRVWVIDALHHVKIFHFFLMSVVEETMTRIYHNTIFLSTSLSLSFFWTRAHQNSYTHLTCAILKCLLSKFCFSSSFLLSFLFLSIFHREKPWEFWVVGFFFFRMKMSESQQAPNDDAMVQLEKFTIASIIILEHLESIRTSSRKTFFVNFYHPLLLPMFSCEMLWEKRTSTIREQLSFKIQFEFLMRCERD